MVYKTVNSPKVNLGPPQTWSNMKVHNGHFHIAGIAAPGATMYDAAKSVFSQIQHLVKAAGGCMDDIMTMTIFVTNLDQNTEVWKARREFFTGDFPCSTLVQVDRVGKPEKDTPWPIEINCSGYVGGSL